MKEEVFNKPLKYLDSLNEKQLTTLYNYLEDIKDNEFRELQRIFKLPLNNSSSGPELWKIYFERKMNLPEVRLFLKQMYAIKEKFGLYPRFKIEKKEKKEETKNEKKENIPNTVEKTSS